MLRRRALTDKELRRSILRWIELTHQLEQVAHQLEHIKDQYANLPYPTEIESLRELDPIVRRRTQLSLDERDLRSQSCRLGNEQAAMDDQIRATLPINVWYRVNGFRLRWVSERHATPRLVYEDVRELEMAA